MQNTEAMYNSINKYILLDGWPANMAGYFYESAVFW